MVIVGCVHALFHVLFALASHGVYSTFVRYQLFSLAFGEELRDNAKESEGVDFSALAQVFLLLEPLLLKLWIFLAGLLGGRCCW